MGNDIPKAVFNILRNPCSRSPEIPVQDRPKYAPGPSRPPDAAPPGQVDAAEVGKTRSLLREDRRLVVNALKLAAANAERLVALRFRQYYQAPNDVFSIFRGLLHLPGTVRSTEADRLEVCLQRPDSPKVARPLEALLRDLNQDQARLFSDGSIFTSPSPDPLNRNGDVLDPVTSEL